VSLLVDEPVEGLEPVDDPYDPDPDGALPVDPVDPVEPVEPVPPIEPLWSDPVDDPDPSDPELPELDPDPIDPELEPEPVDPGLVEPEPIEPLSSPCVALPLDDVPAPLCARAGTAVSSSPAIPRPATTPHPIRFMNFPLVRVSDLGQSRGSRSVKGSAADHARQGRRAVARTWRRLLGEPTGAVSEGLDTERASS
jgi:hypothetical protein